MTELNSVLSWLTIILCLLLLAKFLWKRRWIYYHSWLLPGPLSLPIIGSPSLLLSGQEGFLESGSKMNQTYPPVFRVWMGSQMYIVTSKINHVEFILTNCLQKENILVYKFIDQVFSSLFTTSFHKWQPRRKNLNRSFSQKILSSFFEVQVKMADKMATELELYCGKTDDLLPLLWTTTLDTVFETIGDVDVTTLPEENSMFISMFIRYEELIVERMLNPLHHIDWLWKISSKYKKQAVLVDLFKSQIRETIRRHQNSSSKDGDENDFISRAVKEDYPTKELEEEIAFLFIAGSETSAIVVGSVLLVMSIYPEVQRKLYDEQKTVLDDKQLIFENLNNLDYLERVVKETMRLLAPAPFVLRYVDKTVEIDGQVYPEGSGVINLIQHIHRNPEYWPDPFKFDPNRFLPEEVQKRPRCSYLPFSFGPRNCIGFKYAIMNVKILLSKIIQNFEVLPGPYKSLDEVETVFLLVQKPKDGFPVQLRKR